MRFLLIALLGISTLLGAIDLSFFNTVREASLKKDQFLRVLIFDRDEKRLLTFRWTLFHNQGLVTHTNLDGKPMQHLLYAKYRQDSIKIEIALRDSEESSYHPYLLITFLGYDYTHKIAKFEIYHKDLQSQTRIEIEE